MIYTVDDIIIISVLGFGILCFMMFAINRIFRVNNKTPSPSNEDQK